MRNSVPVYDRVEYWFRRFKDRKLEFKDAPRSSKIDIGKLRCIYELYPRLNFLCLSELFYSSHSLFKNHLQALRKLKYSIWMHMT